MSCLHFDSGFSLLVFFFFSFFLFASFKPEKYYPLKPCSTGITAGSGGERVYQIISAYH